MGLVFARDLSAVHQPTTHGATDTEVDALDEESAQRLLVENAAAS